MARRCMNMRSAKCTIGISSFLLTIFLALLILFPYIYQRVLRNQVTLTDGTLALKIWEDIPVDLYFKLYFFNITNGDRFAANEEPLNVTEVGPYVYKANWTKFDHYWNPNGTISYRELKFYTFVPEMSVGVEEDQVYTLNGPMIMAAAILKNYNWAVRVFLSAAMKFEDENIIIQKSVGELAFRGYEDPLIKYAPELKPDIPFKDGKFGYLYTKNYTDEGVFTVYTGENNSSLTNVITRWNGNDKLSFWKNDSCNSFNGASNVEMGPSPLPDDPGSYTFFQTLLCRPYTYTYTGDVSIKGLPAKRFMPTYDLLANSTENPSNECYEVTKERPSGVIDVSTCQFGAPIFMSYPHFYMADPSYLKGINGLDPNKTDFGSSVDVNPITGFTFGIDLKFQINLQIEHIPGLFQLNSLPEGIFPVMWLNVKLSLNDDWASYIKGQLNNPKYIAYSLFGFLALASFGMAVGGICQVHLNQRDVDQEPLINEDGNKPNQKTMSHKSSYSEVIEQTNQLNSILNSSVQSNS